MPKQVSTSASPYCTPSAALLYVDWRTPANLLSDDGTRLADSGAVASSAAWAELLLAASGEVEAAALRGKRYTPADLAAMTGAQAARLRELVARLAVGKLVFRRPGLYPTVPQDVQDARAALELLANGERVFGFVETMEAGLPGSVNVESADPADMLVTGLADRFFGSRMGSGC